MFGQRLLSSSVKLQSTEVFLWLLFLLIYLWGIRKKLWLDNFQDSEILFYRRYVDDTFCLFHSENQALRFFDYINSRHPNIRFTMEKEVDHKIPFLDVLTNNNNTHFPVTSVYREENLHGPID